MPVSLWRELLVFYLLALTFSWSFWIWIWVGGAVVSHLWGLLGPMMAALVVSFLFQGRSGLGRILRRLIAVPRRPLTALLVAFSPLFALVLVLSVRGIVAGTWPDPRALMQYSGIPAGLSAAQIVVFTLLVNGFGEETGWRGFLFERLEPLLGPLKATLVVIPLWLVWHIPAFLVAPGLHALIGPALIGWAIGLALGAFVLSHVYLLGGRSVLIVAIWHTCFNFASATAATQGGIAAVMSTAVMIWGLIVVGIWVRRSQ